MAEEFEQQEQQEQEERTFTQAELDAIVSRRLSAARKGMPSEDELTAFRSWKEKHTDDDEKMRNITSERDTAQSELEIARRENYLMKKGVPGEDVDFYVYKITKSMKDDEDFDEAADKFLKDNKAARTVRMDTGARFDRGHKEENANDFMNKLIRGERK